jgi:hypothetical protein
MKFPDLGCLVYIKICVDNENKILSVKIHRSNHWADDEVIDFLCRQLNQTQTRFPDSDLTLCFSLVSK